MEEEKLGKLLNELAQRTAEPVRPGLAEDIKHHIPPGLMRLRGRMDTVNIIIHLRVNKLAAAAAIIITMILCASFLTGRDSTVGGIYQNGRMLVEYFLQGNSAGIRDTLSGLSKSSEYLARQGKDAVYYGDSIDPKDSNAVLMHWKLSDGTYRVIYGDLHTEIVGAEQLIKLQARMLQKKTK